MAISTNCWKYLLLAYNVLFAMSAVALFAFSGLLLYRLFVLRHFIGISVEFPAILLTVVGIISCSVAWMGWQSSWSLHRFHVIMFGVLLVLVVAAEFGCFVWCMVVWERVDLDIKGSIDEFFTLAAVQGDKSAVRRWDRLQYQMQCCGVGGPSDYRGSAVPYSCCGQGPLQAGADGAHAQPYAADCTALYQRGCAAPLYEHARAQLFLGAMAALTASVLQSCGVFCAFYLASALRARRASLCNRSARDSALQAGESLLAATAPPKY